jgi:endonuclease/exonuclease/phosphatase family metal-dependent hydrolase
MKKIALIISGLLLTTLIYAQNIADISYGTDNSLEVISWNIEMFPLNEDVTVNNLTQLIPAINADVIAFQEVGDVAEFTQMIDNIPNYDAYVGNSDGWISLAFAYNNSNVQVNSIYEIYTEAEYDIPFLRKPYVLEITWSGEDFVIINNHLKAMGDGVLDTEDIWDEENRRLVALGLLKDYIDVNFATENVIVVGDMNDILTDDPENNVFQAFFNDPDNYAFADYDIAIGDNDNSNWSYPGWPSHIDHILITNELFPSFYAHSSSVETLEIENYLSGGWNEYTNDISDHRPVALKYFPNETHVFDKDFEDQSLTSGDWTAYSVSGAQEWYVPTTQFGHNQSYCGYITGYDSGANENEDWFVSPAFNADMYDDLRLSFWTTSGYSGPQLQVLYSSNYVDNPETASWTEIEDAIFHDGVIIWEWTYSGLVDLSEISGSNARIAFKYTSAASEAATWEIDDIHLSNAPNSFVISADVNNLEAGTISGDGAYVYGETVILTALAEDGFEFLNWTEGGSIVSTDDTFVFTVDTDRDLIANFEIETAIDKSASQDLRVYPNPTDGKLFIEGSEIHSIELFDIRGTKKLAIFSDNEQTILDLSSLTNGLYIIKATTAKGVSFQKIVLN